MFLSEQIIIFLLSYLLGSIPFGLLLARAGGVGDIRSIGSGNIGATNVLRSGRKGLAVTTLLLDLLKGFVAVKLASSMDDYGNTAMLAGLLAVLGHIFPIWLKFRGGKGVATVLGVFFALNLFVALITCAVWLVVFLITRFASLSSIISICLSPIAAYLLDNNALSLLCLTLAIVIVFTHRGNLARLLGGTEPTFKRKDV